MKLFHTSPKEITKIDRFGAFDDCLFFSVEPYSMSVGEVITYSIDAENMSFIDAGDLTDAEIAEGLTAGQVGLPMGMPGIAPVLAGARLENLQEAQQ